MHTPIPPAARRSAAFLVTTALLALLIACPSLPPPTPPTPSPSIGPIVPTRAARGDEVRVTLTGLDPAATTLTLAGERLTTTQPAPDQLAFRVPATVPAGPQTLRATSPAGSAETTLGVLGEVLPRKATALLPAGTSEADLLAVLTPLGYTLDAFRALGTPAGPCSGALAEIDVGGTPLGEALADLEASGVASAIDGISLYDPDTVDALAAVGAPVAQAAGLGGAGVTIAVLDTGVAPHPELGARLDEVAGFDAVDDGDDDPVEAATGPGHATPVALLAAGSTLGVAPEATVISVQVCDGAAGICLLGDVVVGVCHALRARWSELDRLVLLMAFGGDTPTEALAAVLGDALSRGVAVVAAAGNQGAAGSPPHYPAAQPLPGLVAVGALEAVAPNCANGDDLTSGAVFPLLSGFTDGPFSPTVEIYFDAADAPVTSGTTTVVDPGLATGAGNELELVDQAIAVDVATDLSGPADGLTLRYADDGINVNLSVNGADANTLGFTPLDGTTLGGVEISVSEVVDGSGVRRGLLALRGSVSDLTVGGASVWLDELCPAPAATAWQAPSFATTGAFVDLAAPGSGLLSGTPSGETLALYDGSSVAAGLVAGAVALTREAAPDASPEELVAILTGSALELPGVEGLGAGLLDLSGLTP